MCENDFKVSVWFQGESYSFKYGSEAYIFHTGIYNDLYGRYGIRELLRFTFLVHQCYLDDDGPTPLGALADFVAEHWKELNESSTREILTKFYGQ